MKIKDLLEKDVEDLTDEEFEMLEERAEELENEIEYEEKKLDVCGYGKSDLMYIEELKSELAEIQNKIYEE